MAYNSGMCVLLTFSTWPSLGTTLCSLLGLTSNQGRAYFARPLLLLFFSARLITIIDYVVENMCTSHHIRFDLSQA